MKVIINENESYEFKIPETISYSDFNVLVGKLAALITMIDGESPKGLGAKQTSTRPQRRFTRGEIIYLLKILNTQGELSPQYAEVLKKYKISKDRVNQVRYKWVFDYKIKPEEIGLPPKEPKEEKKEETV